MFRNIVTISKMAPTYFKRYTMFKVPKQEDIDTILKQYDVLRKTAVKVPFLDPTEFLEPDR